MLEHPQDRAKAIAKACRAMGGKLIGFWFAFGDYDTAVVVEMPNTESALAVLMSVAAGGSTRNIKTTVLIDAKTGLTAMQKATAGKYKKVRVKGKQEEAGVAEGLFSDLI